MSSVLKTLTVRGPFEILEMLSQGGVYESSSEGVHLKSLSILLGKETVFGFSKARTVRCLFVFLKLFNEGLRKQLQRGPFEISFHFIALGNGVWDFKKTVGERNTSVEYIISFVERAGQRSKVEWVLKVDMKNGYRQMGVHPRKWFTQVYFLQGHEFYIDINMPYG